MIRKFERLQILETFTVLTGGGHKKVSGFRIDDTFALVPSTASDNVLGDRNPEIVSHIPTGFCVSASKAFTFEQACVFVRLLRALPFDWNFSDRDETIDSGISPDVIDILAAVARAVVP